MYRVLSPEEAEQSKQELDLWIDNVDHNTKQHFRALLTPFLKQIHCFHDWINPISFKNDLDKRHIYCRHCKLQKPLDYEATVVWLKEALALFNKETIIFPIDLQGMINFSKFSEPEYIKLYNEKISSREFACYVLMMHYSSIQMHNAEENQKRLNFLDQYSKLGITEKITKALQIKDKNFIL